MKKKGEKGRKGGEKEGTSLGAGGNLEERYKASTPTGKKDPRGRGEL